MDIQKEMRGFQVGKLVKKKLRNSSWWYDQISLTLEFVRDLVTKIGQRWLWHAYTHPHILSSAEKGKMRYDFEGWIELHLTKLGVFFKILSEQYFCRVHVLMELHLLSSTYIFCLQQLLVITNQTFYICACLCKSCVWLCLW